MQEIKTIGFIDETVCGAKETREQINELKRYELDLMSSDGKIIEWNDIDNPEEPRTILHAIEADRAVRVDKNTLMANRPLFAVATIHNNKIIRLEFYEGHDKLKKEFDIRCKNLHGLNLPDYLDKDENAYDPIELLKEIFEIKVDEDILKKLHGDK